MNGGFALQSQIALGSSRQFSCLGTGNEVKLELISLWDEIKCLRSEFVSLAVDLGRLWYVCSSVSSVAAVTAAAQYSG